MPDSPDPAQPDADTLSLKREKFVNEYLVDGNATQAAIRAGYSEASAHVTGSRLLDDAKVSEAIETKKEQLFARYEITQETILQQVAAIAFEKLSDDPRQRFFQGPRVLKACELLGKHKKLWTDKVQHEGNVTVNVVDPYSVPEGEGPELPSLPEGES